MSLGPPTLGVSRGIQNPPEELIGDEKRRKYKLPRNSKLNLGSPEEFTPPIPLPPQIPIPRSPTSEPQFRVQVYVAQKLV